VNNRIAQLQQIAAGMAPASTRSFSQPGGATWRVPASNADTPSRGPWG
jgi:hypothetical protein